MHVHMHEMHAKEDGLQDNTYIQTYSTCIHVCTKKHQLCQMLTAG